MWIYILNLLTIPIYAILIKDKKKFIILVALQLFLILALRDTTLGVDMGNYSGGFKYISNMSFSDLISSLRPSGVASLTWPYYYENGYTVLNWIVSHLGQSFHTLLVICAAINISSVSFFIYKYSKKPWLSFAIFCALGFYMTTFGILRQSLALSVVLIAYILADHKKYFWTALMLILAFSFHRAALLAVPIILLLLFTKKSISRKTFTWMLLFSLPIMLFSNFIYSNIILSLIEFMGKSYTGHDLEVNKKIFLYIGIALISILTFDFKKLKTKIDSVACYAIIFSVYFVIFGLYNDNLSRALQFFSIFLLIFIPNIFEQYKNQKYLVLVEVAVFFLLLIYMCSITVGTSIDPYVFYDEMFALTNGNFIT